MTDTPTENDSTDKGQESNAEEVKIHPAYQEILDSLPESLHSQVIPTLKKWDEGVQKKINDLHTTYDPYKNFIENNVPTDYIEQAIVLMDSFNENPEEVVAKAVEHYNLDWAQKAELEKQLKEAERVNRSSNDDDDDDLVDLEEDERFLEVQKTTKELAEWRKAQEEEREAAKEQKEYEDLMSDLHEKHGEFDDTVVTALLASGMDGEKAVKRYEEIVNQAAAKISNQGVPTPPKVLGGNGSSGSGIPHNDISFGKMKQSDVNAVVAEMLSKADKG